MSVGRKEPVVTEPEDVRREETLSGKSITERKRWVSTPVEGLASDERGEETRKEIGLSFKESRGGRQQPTGRRGALWETSSSLSPVALPPSLSFPGPSPP